ncbi:MAG: tyrosine-protein kinase, partial [Subtercola sp.]|nr:tyrosine-protein kinase [Subtercola sp.]
MTVHDYLRIIRAHWIVLAVVVIGGAAAGGALTFFQPRVYSANSSGIVSLVSTGTIGETVASDALAKSKSTTYVSVGESRVVAQRVITSLGLTVSPEELAGRVNVSSVRDTPTIDITATASTGLAAKTLADAWIAGLAAQIEVIEAQSMTQGVTSPAAAPTTFLIPVEPAA